MEKLNEFLTKLFNLMIKGLLILFPIALVFRMVESHRAAQAGAHTEWVSILYLFILIVELYLLVVFLWLRSIHAQRIGQQVKLVQLILIFLIGILPGLLSVYPAFFKQ